MDFNIKYEMEKYAHSLSVEATSSLEDAIQIALTGKRLSKVTEPRKDIDVPANRIPNIEPNIEHNITSPYGKRRSGFHSAIDIGAKIGSPVYSFDDGVVKSSSYDDRSGNYIIIYHKDEELTSSYSHLSKIYVRRGQKVSKGDTIGLVGNTGRSHGAHLHFRLKLKNKDVNPELFIANRRLVG